MGREVVEQILQFNQGRIADRLQAKYAAMAIDPFTFLRGTCHLFYQDLPPDAGFSQAPVVWSCGDLHLQNFGTFRGDDRIVYFDINDFDEAVLAPCTWDLVRFLTGVLVTAHSLGIKDDDAEALCQIFLQAYTAALATGKPRNIHRETAIGMVDELLTTLRERKSKQFLRDRLCPAGSRHKRSGRKGSAKGTRLKLIPQKTSPTRPEEQRWVTHLIQSNLATQPELAHWFAEGEILDIVHRWAGNSSLGLERYLILLRDRSGDRSLLDLKAARPSCVAPHLAIHQPNWTSEAERIVQIQTRVQEAPPALLHSLTPPEQTLGHDRDHHTQPSQILGSQVVDSYVLRELQPTEDKIDLRLTHGKPKRLAKVIRTMAEVTAWGQLRSGGRQGSAIADTLIDFAREAPTWQAIVLQYARHYAEQVETDYQIFHTAWQKGLPTFK
ncbi:MAG: DUF2252 family protein [Synechococcales bacterium]|nr:DUF2252 family protein [Synechococcales bacterium]